MSKQITNIIRDENEWNRVVTATNAHDFYHLNSYHKIAENNGEGSPLLFYYREDDRFIAMPFLTRPVHTVKGLEKADKKLTDATSVYGYAGPITNSKETDEHFIQNFNTHLTQFLNENSIVTAFSRLHPVLENHRFLSQDHLIAPGNTISIDLTLPETEQLKGFRKNNIRSIKNAYKQGVKVHVDDDWKYLQDFMDIYKTTMDKVSATDYYYFEESYFHSLREALGDSLKLFAAEYEGKIVSASLFTFTKGIVQYHLSGSLPEYSKLCAFHCILDNVRRRAVEQQATDLHLGGGVGNGEDHLFFFKAGFSKRRHKFHLWKNTINPGVYEELKEMKSQWNRENNLTYMSESYFPIYRGETK
ncbi:MAG: aminoacyltransferase [bacterium]|nr:aminoacyltransferase [bacterium]